MKLKFFFFSFFYMFCCAFAFTQKSNIYLQLNGSLFTSGETVNGAILIPTLNANGIVFNVAISDLSGKNIESFFVKVKDNTGSFSFDLPYNLPTDYFYVSVNSLDKKLNKINVVNTLFFSMNNTNEDAKLDFSLFDLSKLRKKSKSSQFLEVEKPNKDEVIINLLNDVNPLSIVVSDSEWEPNINLSESELMYNQEEIKNWSNKIFLHGKLTKNEVPFQWNILGLYNNESDKFYLTKSDVNGSYISYFDDFYGTKYFQLLTHGMPLDKIKLHNQETLLKDIPRTTKSFSDSEKIVLSTYKLKSKINQYFKTAALNNETESIVRSNQTIVAQKKYIPSNFKKFNLLDEFCKENNVPLQFKKTDKEYSASINVPSSFAKKFNTIATNPLFLVNGLLTRNLDKIANLKIDDIDYFELFYDPETLRKTYNVFGSETLVKIFTKSNSEFLTYDELNCNFTLKGFKNVKNSQQSIILNRQKNLSPIFEPHLFWQVNPQHKAVKFFKSDDKVNYTITAIFLNENGKLEAFSQPVNLYKK